MSESISSYSVVLYKLFTNKKSFFSLKKIILIILGFTFTILFWLYYNNNRTDPDFTFCVFRLSSP